MADKTPSDVPPIPIPPIVDLAGTGGEPDDSTVVRPRKKAEPKAVPPAEPAAAVPAAVPAAAVPVAAAPVPPVEAAPVAPPAANPYAQPNPYAQAPAAPAAQPNPYAAPAAQPQPYAAAGAAPQPYSYGPYVPQPPKGLSITSMALGLGGLFFSFFGFGFLIVVAAVVTGHLASKRQPYAKGFWLTGIISGYVGIGFSLIYGAIWVFWIVLAFSS